MCKLGLRRWPVLCRLLSFLCSSRNPNPHPLLPTDIPLCTNLTIQTCSHSHSLFKLHFPVSHTVGSHYTHSSKNRDLKIISRNGLYPQSASSTQAGTQKQCCPYSRNGRSEISVLWSLIYYKANTVRWTWVLTSSIRQYAILKDFQALLHQLLPGSPSPTHSLSCWQKCTVLLSPILRLLCPTPALQSNLPLVLAQKEWYQP
jgi:hypothetical protein